MIKVYEVITKPYQDFSFYNRNGILTLCSDPKFPFISGTSIYDGSIKNWTRINNPMNINSADKFIVNNGGSHISSYINNPDKMICPGWFVRQKHYIDHIKEQLDPLLETSFTTYGDNKFNIFIFKKYLNLKKENKDLLCVGMGAQSNIKSLRCHSEFTKHCQCLLKLKAFW